MYQVYAKQDVILPSGRKMTFDEIKKSEAYQMLANVPCMVDIDEDGILYTMTPVSNVKHSNNIEAETPEEVVSKYVEMLEERRSQAQKEAASIEDIQAQLDALTGATA